jgi:Asp-tRNA(Asn)/Glu-tRNA(Gln) amidotransferase A subunit family amidase
MTRTVADSVTMLQSLAGYDAEEATSSNVPVPDYAAQVRQTGPLRVGIPRAYFYEKLDAEVESALNSAITVIQKLASSVRDVDTPASNDTTILRAEAYAYHADNIKKNAELYQPETLRRIRSAEDVTTVAYIQARRQVDQYRRTITKTFESVDLLITPTTPVPPFTIAELLGDANNLRTKEILMLRNTRPFNILGLPTISVPCGFSKAGLPIGMQITGGPWEEAKVFKLAEAYEQQTEWHRRHPENLVIG